MILRFRPLRRLAAALVALTLPAAAHAATSARPNVLFIVVDDLRPDLGCYGAPARTPAFDSLARTGLLFERAYCQQAVCNPSRASALSGARPDTTGVIDNGRSLRGGMSDVVTLPQHFKAHGYHTVSIGKVFHHEEVETGGDVLKRPGDDPVSWSEAPWFHGEPYAQWFRPESLAITAVTRPGRAGEPPVPTRGPAYEAADVPDDAPPDGQIAGAAIAALRRLRDRTFFLAVGFRRPHLPLNAPQKYWDLHPPETIRLPANSAPPEDAPPAALHTGYELRSYAGMPKSGPIPEREALNLIRAYRASVSYMDAQLGRVLSALKDLGLDDNTLVVVWGDHGYHLGEQGLWTKMTNFEAGTRVPLILRAPGRTKPGSRTRGLVELVDLYPSLADLCGLPLPSHLEGTSFTPLLTAPDRAWKKAAFSQYPRMAGGRFKPDTDPVGRSLRTPDFRYTEWVGPDGKSIGTELYDLNADPGETRNLAPRPEQRERVAALSAQLTAGWRSARP